jgi:DNA-directed RNA polymerase subunit H (RpoH/RPB5)
MFDKAIKITKEMYTSRGWTIIEEEPKSITAKIISDDGHETLATAKFIETTQDIKTPMFQGIIESDEYDCITIVCNGSITTNVKKIENMTKGKVELFHNNDLQMNITTYHLQPKFQKLSQSDSKDFKMKYLKCKIEKKNGKEGTSKLRNFPIMLKSDPVARYFRYKSGDVIRVITSDDEISYRIVK